MSATKISREEFLRTQPPDKMLGGWDPDGTCWYWLKCACGRWNRDRDNFCGDCGRNVEEKQPCP